MSYLFRILSDTPFRLSEPAYKSMRKALLAFDVCGTPESGLLSICGRHPMNGGMAGLGGAFLNMVMAGSPDGSEPVDGEFASVYMRLFGEPKDAAVRQSFAAAKAAPAPPLSGHWSLNYAGLAVHRRPGWLVGIKGYNRWVEASEIYATDNRWGRYLSNGGVQILSQSGSMLDNGIRQEGWDWNRSPGATMVHLPLEKLECPFPYVQKRSAQIMATGTDLEGDGVFGFALDEDDSPLNAEGCMVCRDENGRTRVYGNGLKGRLSVFCFGDYLVCLGSGIASVNRDYPTETILFQNALKRGDQPVFVNAVPALPGLPSEETHAEAPGTAVVDAVGNAFYVTGTQKVRLSRREQESFNNKTPKGRVATTGLFAAGWIDHGNAPTDAGYEYAILPQGGERADAFFAKMKSQETRPYRILRRDKRAHVVLDRDSRVTGHVFFEPCAMSEGLVAAVSAPAVVMIAEKKDGLLISLVDPNLNAEPFQPETTHTPPTEILLTLRGVHAVQPSERVSASATGDGMTALRFQCRYGEAVKARLDGGATKQ